MSGLRTPVITPDWREKCDYWIDLTMAIPDYEDVEYDEYWSVACDKDKGHEGPHHLVMEDDSELEKK